MMGPFPCDCEQGPGEKVVTGITAHTQGQDQGRKCSERGQLVTGTVTAGQEEAD